MSRLTRFVIRAVAPIAAGTLLLAQAPVVIKVATFAPANTTWAKALDDMGAEWAAKTGGRVKLQSYTGGRQGTEKQVVAFMRPAVNRLQAGLLMSTGLSEIDNSVNVFGMPFFLQSDAELKAVLDAVGPVIAKRFEDKGYHVLNWGGAGWVEVFSKQPIHNLDDLKNAKLFTTESGPELVQWYNANGFHPVVLSETDIVGQLKLPNGMINAAPSPPYGALALQFFRSAPYMLDLHIAPLVGSTVITTATWNKISEADRATMTASAQAMQERVFAAVPKLNADSIAAMQKTGLKVMTPDAAALKEIRDAGDKLVAAMRGTMVPQDIYDLALKARDAFRQKTGGRPQR